MKNSKLIAFLIIFVFIGMVGCKESDIFVEKMVPIPNEWKICKTDSDCEIVDPSCTGCCFADGINKKYKDLFLKSKEKDCADFSGPICDCIYQDGTPKGKCVSGTCVVEFEPQS